MVLIGPIVAALIVASGPPPTQECRPTTLTTEQQQARRNAIRVARMINSVQANQPGRLNGKFLSQAELHAAHVKQVSLGADPFIAALNFTPGSQLMENWSLKLDVTPNGYWFIIHNDNDPCGFSVVSNEQGVIFTAEPIR